MVVNYRSHALLAANVAPGFGRASGFPGRVVVVDNYSSAAERGAVRDLCRRERWTLVEQEANPGFAAGCNAGVAAARALGAAAVVLVNPDATVTRVVVEALAEQLREEPMTLVSPLLVTSAGRPFFRGSRVDLTTGRMRGRTWADDAPARAYLESPPPLRDWLTAACLGVSGQLWEAAGGMDERYFLYWEDVDFSARCVAAGARLCLRHDLVAVHDEGGTHGPSGSRARSPLYYRYNCRNRLVYGSRHLSRRDLLRWVLATPQESRQILLRGGRRQLLHSPAPMVATVSGSLAGLARATRALLGRRTGPPATAVERSVPR